LKSSLRILQPPPKLTVSKWADNYRVLSPEASSETGRFETARAMYQQEIMDCISDPTIEEVIFMSGSQIGKTEILLNAIGYYIAYDASPILMIQPTIEMARGWSQDRLAPMLRDSPILMDKVADVKSRDSGNTVLHKQFDGGHISIVGANSPSGLASRPIKIVLCDEVDRYPPSAGTEGDPVSLAKRRSATFWDRKIIMTSTPTTKGASRIESAYDVSDQRQYHVPCKDCNTEQVLKWSQVTWEENQPETAHYVCEDCGSCWDDSDRLKAISRGRWIGRETFNGRAGFHLAGIYSVWTTLEEAVKEFLVAKKLPETLRVFVNTYLGESWEDEGEQLDNADIMKRVEDYGEKYPEQVAIITAGVDVQDDRLELEVIGWGRDEESWSLEYHVIYGDPSSPQLWQQLDEKLSAEYETFDGRKLKITSSCVDSGGHHTQSVYNFCKQRFARRIFAIKGMGGTGKGIVGKPSRNNIAKVHLFPIGVDTVKELIYSRLRITELGAGYCHFPKKYDKEYFSQLTAEKVVTKYHRGFARREWVKIRTRNEALDCRVYGIAALTILNVDLNRLADRLDSKDKMVDKVINRNKSRSNFANSW